MNWTPPYTSQLVSSPAFARISVGAHAGQHTHHLVGCAWRACVVAKVHYVCLSSGFKQLSSDPAILRSHFKLEYDSVVGTTDLVQLINSYTTPEASNIVQLAKNKGFIPQDSGPALHRRGLVHDEIADADLDKQRLCARKAALQETLEQHRLALSEATYQSLQVNRQRTALLIRKRATESRVGAQGARVQFQRRATGVYSLPVGCNP